LDAAISTATLIRYALTTLGIFALIFLLTLLTPWMAKKVDAWIARYRQNHSEEKNETYGVHSIYELPTQKTEGLSEIPQDAENEMSEEAWKEEKPIVPEVDWFEDAPPDDGAENIFSHRGEKVNSMFLPDDDDFEEDFEEEEDVQQLMDEDELEEDDFDGEDDPLAMRQPAYDDEPEAPQFMNICGLLSGEPEPTYPPEGLEMVTSLFYEEPYPNAVPQVQHPVPVQTPMPEPLPTVPPEPVQEEFQPVRLKGHAKREEVTALLGKLIDKQQLEENSSFRHWEADPYDEEAEELDEEDFEYDDDIDDDEEDYDDEGWFRPAP